MFIRGIGLEKNYENGIKWMIQAAENGDVTAMYYLGEEYYDLKEYELALKWNQMAAEEGNSDSMCFLGTMHYKGLGMENDYNKAFYFFDKIVKLNTTYKVTPGAAFMVGSMYYQGLGVQKDNKQAIAYLELAHMLGAGEQATKLLDEVKKL